MQRLKPRRVYRTRDGSFVIFRRVITKGRQKDSFLFTNLVTAHTFAVKSTKRAGWFKGLVDWGINVKCKVG